MIPASVRFDQSTMASLLEVDPLVQEYRAFFSLLDWSVVERWQAQRSACCGSHGHPLTAYIKAVSAKSETDYQRQGKQQHPMGFQVS